MALNRPIQPGTRILPLPSRALFDGRSASAWYITPRMKRHTFRLALLLTAAALLVPPARGQDSTPPATSEELESSYTIAIEGRTSNILRSLSLPDAGKAARVHDIIITQYRALRTRDVGVERLLSSLSKDAAGVETNRAAITQLVSRSLHDQFLARLGRELTPEQIEAVKDRMTYGKVKHTYDAYCAIVPNLTEPEKARIMELLTQARDEAIDGGSAGEKTDIFQKYKDRINDYLNARGRDVAKATAEWEAKQEAASQTAEAAAP
jgi:hypothetical protein